MVSGLQFFEVVTHNSLKFTMLTNDPNEQAHRETVSAIVWHKDQNQDSTEVLLKGHIQYSKKSGCPARFGNAAKLLANSIMAILVIPGKDPPTVSALQS